MSVEVSEASGLKKRKPGVDESPDKCHYVNSWMCVGSVIKNVWKTKMLYSVTFAACGCMQFVIMSPKSSTMRFRSYLQSTIVCIIAM